MATKTQVLNWFRGELGYVEGKNNDNKYAKIAGHTNYAAWCASFQVAGFRSCKMKLGNESAFTPSLLNSLEDEKVDKPQAGALAFLYFPSLERVAHVGIVETVRKDGRFVTIEGNTDVAGGRTGGRVMRKVRSHHGFTFVMPEYDSESPSTPTSTPNNYGNCVKLQKAVRVNPDNNWGDATDKACDAIRWASQTKFPFGVKFVQRVLGIEDDGAWGGVSRRALRQTVLDCQVALVEMSHVKFPRTGIWDTPTESAYQKVRKICRRP